MKVIIIGATGLIGKAVAALLTDKGHEIVQASRNTQPGLHFCTNSWITLFNIDNLKTTSPARNISRIWV